MISLAAVAAKPALLSNPVTAAITGGVSLAQLAARKIGQGRKAATKFVSGFEGPFGQQLAQISRLADTNPDAATEQLRSSWNTFHSEAQKMIAKGGNDAKVARQSLSNVDLIRTVDTLAAQLGIPNLRSGGSSVRPAPSSFSGNPQGVPLSDVAAGGLWSGILPDYTGGRNKVQRTPNQFPVGQLPINRFPPLTPPGPDIKTPPMKTPSGGQWDWLLDAILPASISGGLNLAGGYLGSKAAKEAAAILSAAGLDAAKLMSETTDKVLAQQKGIYEQSREDMMPWLNTGKAALGQLSNRMGLPGATGTNDGVPDLDTAAERYRRGRMRV